MQETTETTIDLREVFLILLGGLRWIVLASLVGILVAFAATWWIISPKYTSSVLLYVNNTGESGAQIAGAVNINDLNASQRLVNTYAVILQDDEVLQQIADRLMLEYTEESLAAVLPFAETPGGRTLRPQAIRDVITLTAVNNTEVMQVEATTKNAELSARICTIMTQVAPPTLQRVVKAGSVEVIGEAKIADEPSSPNLLVNLVVGFLAGFVLSVAAVLLVRLLDNTVTDEEEIKKRFNIPILGLVPDFEDVTKARGGGYSYASKEKN